MPLTKKFYYSKTFWVNVFMYVVFIAYPPSREFVGGEKGLSTIFMVVNLVLRMVTKSKIQIL